MVESLPDVAVSRVLKNLDIGSVVCLSEVSIHLQNVVSQCVDCRSLNFEGCQLSGQRVVQFIRSLGQRCQRISMLSLNFCFWFNSQELHAIIQRCPNLLQLHVLDCRLTQDALETLLSKLDHVTALSFTHFPNASCKGARVAETHMLFKDLHKKEALQSTLRSVTHLTVHVGAFGYKCKEGPNCGLVVYSSKYLPNLKSLDITHRLINGCFCKYEPTLQVNFLQDLSWKTFPRLSSELHRDDPTHIGRYNGFFKNRTDSPWCNVTVPTLFTTTGVANRNLESLALTSSTKKRLNSNGGLSFQDMPNLKHLCVRECWHFNSWDLITVSENCPQLQTIDLRLCSPEDVFYDMDGISSVINMCNIQRINLSDVCPPGGNLCQLISQLKGLKSLALSPCAIFDNSEAPCKPTDDDIQDPFYGLFKRKRVAKETDIRRSNLQCLVDGCPLVEDFALATKSGPRSVYGIFSSRFGHNRYFRLPRRENCPNCDFVRDKHLCCLSGFKMLKSLVVSNMKGVKSFEFLSGVLESCKQMEFLSVSNLGSGTISSKKTLSQALEHGHRLKDLRLEQVSLSMVRIMPALSKLTNLHRVCFVTCLSKLEEGHCLEALMDKNPRLTRMYLCTNDTVSFSQRKQTHLKTKYKERAGLVVHFFTKDTLHVRRDQLMNSPFPDVKELVYFHLPTWN